MPRKPYTHKAERQPCPHCKRACAANSISKHIPVCVLNPVVADPLRAFMIAFAEDGCLMSARRYRQLSPTANQPSLQTLMSAFGTWKAFAKWCGLRAHPQPKIHRVHRLKPELAGFASHKDVDAPLPENFRLFHLPLRKAEQPEGLPVYEAKRCIRAWDVKGHNYVPVGWQKVYAVR